MWKVSVVLIVSFIFVDCEKTFKECLKGEANKRSCIATYNCRLPYTKFISAQLCGYDSHYKQPLVCCQPSESAVENFVRTTLVTPQTIYLTGLLNNETKISTIIKVPTVLRTVEDLQLLGNKARIKFKVTNISRYKRAAQMELFTSNPLVERESDVLPNPVALSVKTTDPPLELFTSPPIAGEASVVPEVVPLQSQTDKPDTSSIMNLYTSAPLPPRGNTNAPPVENPTTISTTPTVTKEPTSKPTPPPSTPKHTKKPVYPVDSRPIVFEDSLPTTTTESDQIYFPDKVPGAAQNEVDSKLNALSVGIPQATPQITLEKVLPNRHTCGLQKTNKYGESPVAGLDEFPWVALLRYVDNSNNDAGFRCSGSLISDHYVLTAGHCLEVDSMCVDSVRLGEWKVSSKHDCMYYHGKTECANKVMDVKVEKKILHGQYEGNSRNNDIALLRLQKRVPCTDYIRPICLPIKNLRDPQLGTTFTTSGWGTTPFGFQLDLKSKINFPVIHKDYCKEYESFKEQTCIGYYKRHDFGKMDPGGPVMALDITGKPQWYLEGVMVRGYGCNLLSYPGAYTRLTYYIDWLIETILRDARQ